MKTQNDTIETILSELTRASRVVIATHINPDGDAVGSSLALGLILRGLGKDVRIAMRKGDVGAPACLTGFETVVDPDEIREEPDLLVCLDCGSRSRVFNKNLGEKIGSWRTVNIDHHGSNDFFADFNYVFPDRSSTGEIIWTLAEKAGWPLSPAVAEALWVAIVTDTGRFSYPCTSPSTLRCGAALQEVAGSNRTAWLNDMVYNQVDRKVLQLRARCQNHLECWFDGLVTVVYLDGADFEETGCAKRDTEEFTDIPRSVRGSKIALFFYCLGSDDPKTHISLRARAPYKVSDIAAHFGGGGHDAAAGATIEAPIAEAMTRVKDYLAARLS